MGAPRHRTKALIFTLDFTHLLSPNSPLPATRAPPAAGQPRALHSLLVLTAPLHTLEEEHWLALEHEHRERADLLSAAHRARRARGEKHPIEDFLWTYYSVTPAELRRWHPGAGILLRGAVDRASRRYYRLVGEADAAFDPVAYAERRSGTVDYIERLLRATLERTPRYGCFGLHEWAMVYRMTPEQLRHTALPLRIGHAATDAVVEQTPISCTHFDAFRFFTSDAVALNRLQPTRETQPELEQPGCLHAGMDVYKWAAKLGPVVPGSVLLDAFELARDIREVDMRASPYDVSGFAGATGSPLRPIPIETPEGKRAYAQLQRGFAERGNTLRERVLAAIDAFRSALAAAR